MALLIAGNPLLLFWEAGKLRSTSQLAVAAPTTHQRSAAHPTFDDSLLTTSTCVRSSWA